MSTDLLSAGNRWHTDCFRCDSCKMILDDGMDLLFVSNGLLLCNNCTYHCSICGNKIENHAILFGGDQVFCATCFRCRNCNKKIENLKYARTSQGNFCMSCHDRVMETRRRKSAKMGTRLHMLEQSFDAAVSEDKPLPPLPLSATYAEGLGTVIDLL